jgi:hypothetical protein
MARRILQPMWPEMEVSSAWSDPSYREPRLQPAIPVTTSFSLLVSPENDPGDVTADEYCAFIKSALENPRQRFLVEMAFAHIAAAEALSDQYWYCDRYKTRVDEAVSVVWEIAQEIYELNSEIALPYRGTRIRERKAVGLERAGRKWASAELGSAQQ